MVQLRSMSRRWLYFPQRFRGKRAQCAESFAMTSNPISLRLFVNLSLRLCVSAGNQKLRCGSGVALSFSPRIFLCVS